MSARRGFALSVVILVLALLALLVTAGVEAARGARRTAALAQTDAELQSAAERALGNTVAGWPTAFRTLAVGDRGRIDAGATPSGIAVAVTVTRVAAAIYWVTAEARVGAGSLARDGVGAGGRRRINAILSLPPLGLAVDGALIAAGTVVAAGATVSADSAPAGCPPLRADSAYVAVPVADTVIATPAGSVPWRRLSGAGDPAALDQWGGVTRADLGAADLELPTGAIVTADGDCASGAGSGWGSGGAVGCAARFTVVHAAGDLTIDGGGGAGVLLVDGRLRITGAFRFTGLVVARGGIDVVAAGAGFIGAVVAGTSATSGTPSADLAVPLELRASRCAVWRVLAARAVPRLAAARWWGELL